MPVQNQENIKKKQLYRKIAEVLKTLNLSSYFFYFFPKWRSISACNKLAFGTRTPLRNILIIFKSLSWIGSLFLFVNWRQKMRNKFFSITIEFLTAASKCVIYLQIQGKKSQKYNFEILTQWSLRLNFLSFFKVLIRKIF